MGTKLAALVLVVTAAWAHHSFQAEFDAKKPIKLRGVVTRMEWVNPHAWMHLDVTRSDGKVVSWMIEADTPNTLFRRGFTKDSLKIGTEVVVDVYPAKDGSKMGNGRDVTLPDGRRLFFGSTGPGAPNGDKGK